MSDKLYKEKTANDQEHGRVLLSVEECRKLMKCIIPKDNDNDGSNKDFVEVIHDKLINDGIKSVFGEVTPPTNPSETEATPEPVSLPEPKPVSNSGEPPCKIPLNSFLKQFNNNTFKKDTFSKFRLVGCDGYEEYSTEYHDSAYNLTWSFVMNLIKKKGTDYINAVEQRHPGLKNPVFITNEVYMIRNDQNKYRQVDVEGYTNYYMYKHFSQYQWVDSVLKQRLADFGLPSDKFVFEYYSETSVIDDISEPGGDPPIISDAVFRYMLWNNEYTADKLASMMHDVFDTIAAKYPGKVAEMAKDNTITSVALKTDVDNKTLPDSKL